MADIALSIPYLVLSTKVGPRGYVEKHVLTPFGDVDIKVFALSVMELGEMTLEILVGGTLDSWMLWDPMIDEFRGTLMRFVGRIVQELLGELYPEIDWWRIHFQETESKRLISACLASGEGWEAVRA